MSGRYFVNNLQDYIEGEAVNVPKGVIYRQIEDVKQRLVEESRLDKSSCEGGIYLGISGVAFALIKLLELPAYKDDEGIRKFLGRCLEVSLKYEESSQKRENKPGLLLGTSGVLLTAALFHKFITKSEEEVSELVQSYAALKDICNPPAPSNPDYLNCGSDEILLGRAGYLYGVHVLSRKLTAKVLDTTDVSGICKTVVDVGRQTSSELSSVSPLMYQYHTRQFLGAAHGLSGILQTLLIFPEFVKSDQSIEKDIKGSIDYLLSVQRPDGNFAPLAEMVHEKVGTGEGLVHWCHGAPGVIFLLAKAYTFWNEEKYLQACVKCADLCWTYGLLKKGPGICHGVAGNGYPFLLMYRLTQQPKYLHRAIKFAEFMESEEFKRDATIPDHPLSLYEGLAGTLCYLIDLLDPAKAEFPLFDIF